MAEDKDLNEQLFQERRTERLGKGREEGGDQGLRGKA